MYSIACYRVGAHLIDYQTSTLGKVWLETIRVCSIDERRINFGEKHLNEAPSAEMGAGCSICRQFQRVMEREKELYL